VPNRAPAMAQLFQATPPHADQPFAFAGLRDVIGSLHAHQSVHLHAKRLFNAERHVAGQVGLLVEQARQRGPRDAQGCGSLVTVMPAASTSWVRIKSPGWGGFFMGMAKGSYL
jgi:hypothetical protein